MRSGDARGSPERNMSSTSATLPGATTLRYEIRSEIALACLPSAQKDPGRKVMWVNAICAAFLATGIMGVKAPLDMVLRTNVVEETTVVPVEFVPPPVQTPPEVSEDTPPPDDSAAPVPAVVQPVVVVADSSSVPFAVPVEGLTVTTRDIRQASPPPVRPVAVAPPPPQVQTGPRTLRPGEGANEGIFAPQPEYPIEARRKGIEGMVKLEIEVDETGSVAEVRKLIPSGSFVLDNNTITWVKRRWRFPAGKRQVLHTEFVYTLSDGR